MYVRDSTSRPVPSGPHTRGKTWADTLHMSGNLTPMWAAQQQRELNALTGPDQICLVEGARTATRSLLNTLGDALGVIPRSMSEVGLAPTPARTTDELLDRLSDNSVFFDLEALCWQPWLKADPLRFLRRLARRRGVVAIWPGAVRNGTASFSTPGRNDYVSFSASGLIVLRPVVTRFPDEVPYTLERIP